LSPENEHPKWWVDSSYAVHPVIIMSLGKEATYTASTKQKLNTKSSFCPMHNMLADFLLNHYKEQYLHECAK